MIVEICANSYESAINAEKAGAHRIELCSELAVGGITPSFGLLQKVMQDTSIPVHVLIRPRSGDFTYSDQEFEIMTKDVEICKELGVSGIVSGVLNNDMSIDKERTQELVELSEPMSFTFHRAFDWLIDPINGIYQLGKLGVDRILTSGQESSAEQGIELLKELRNETSIIIMPGGGINANNASMFKENGFKELHLSATKKTQTIEIPKISMNSLKHFEETQIAVSDIQTIQNILSQVND